MGDLLGILLDADGRPIDHPINERVIGISLDDIRAIPDAILAAGGAHKLPVLRGVLSLGVVDTFVTDEATARGPGREPARARAGRPRGEPRHRHRRRDLGRQGRGGPRGRRRARRAGRAAGGPDAAPGLERAAPDAWVEATGACLDALAARDGALMWRVEAIGLSGQMLGAVLIDGAERPLRPAILWNDQRAQAECAALLDRVPDIGRRANGKPDPGLTAPKLLWLAAHEPEMIGRAAALLLPKDYLRLWLTGERATEPSDAGGTMLMDCATGRWDPELCAAAGWDAAAPPHRAVLVGRGRAARRAGAALGLREGLPVAAGAGDNMPARSAWARRARATR